jgi:hypothetical protein
VVSEADELPVVGVVHGHSIARVPHAESFLALAAKKSVFFFEGWYGKNWQIPTFYGKPMFSPWTMGYFIIDDLLVN